MSSLQESSRRDDDGSTTTTRAIASSGLANAAATTGTGPSTSSRLPTSDPGVATQTHHGGSIVSLQSNLILVNERQRGNGVLKHIRNVKFEFSRAITVDYAMNSTCVLFLSVKYHTLHPAYVELRMRETGERNYRLRVLLTLVDDEHSSSKALLELNRICFIHDFVLVLAWSEVECARYLETLKEYEGKPSSVIQEKSETEFLPKVSKILTSVKSVNKTDVNTLLDVFGNVKNVFNAEEHQLVLVPGLGDKKVKRLYHAMNEPFLVKSSKKDT